MDLQKEYFSFLKNEIKKHCNNKRFYKVSLDKNKQKLIGNITNNKQILQVLEEHGFYLQDELYLKILNDVKNVENTELKKYILDNIQYNDFWGDLSFCGFNGISFCKV